MSSVSDYHFVAVGLALVSLAIVLVGARWSAAHAVSRIYGDMLENIGPLDATTTFEGTLEAAREGSRWALGNGCETTAWAVVLVVAAFLTAFYHAGSGVISRRLAAL